MRCFKRRLNSWAVDLFAQLSCVVSSVLIPFWDFQKMSTSIFFFPWKIRRLVSSQECVAFFPYWAHRVHVPRLLTPRQILCVFLAVGFVVVAAFVLSLLRCWLFISILAFSLFFVVSNRRRRRFPRRPHLNLSEVVWTLFSLFLTLVYSSWESAGQIVGYEEVPTSTDFSLHVHRGHRPVLVP